jgi:hypothetical protein
VSRRNSVGIAISYGLDDRALGVRVLLSKRQPPPPLDNFPVSMTPESHDNER